MKWFVAPGIVLQKGKSIVYPVPRRNVIVPYTASAFRVQFLHHDCTCSSLNARPTLNKSAGSNALTWYLLVIQSFCVNGVTDLSNGIIGTPSNLKYANQSRIGRHARNQRQRRDLGRSLHEKSATVSLTNNTQLEAHIANCWQTNKVFWLTARRLRCKKYPTDGSINPSLRQSRQAELHVWPYLDNRQSWKAV